MTQEELAAQLCQSLARDVAALIQSAKIEQKEKDAQIIEGFACSAFLHPSIRQEMAKRIRT